MVAIPLDLEGWDLGPMIKQCRSMWKDVPNTRNLKTRFYPVNERFYPVKARILFLVDLC